MFKKRIGSRRDDRESSWQWNVFWGGLSCLFLTLVLWGVWSVTRLPSLTIKEITVEGGDTIPHSAVRAAAEEVLAGDYLKIIPHRFFLTYPHDALVAAVENIDRMHSVAVNRVDRNTLHIAFTEYAPYALWCDGHHDAASCYFLDAEGYAFARSPQLQGNAFTRHVIEGETELREKQVFEAAPFFALHAFLEKLQNELKLRVHEIEYTSVGDLVLYVNGGGKIYMRREEEYTDVFENLATILSSPAFTHLEPGNFQYIDVRFGNKIFVNETPEITVSTSTEATTTATTTLGE